MSFFQCAQARQTDTRTCVKKSGYITFFDLCNYSIHHGNRPLGLSALLISPVFLLLFTGTGGQIGARLPAITSSLVWPTMAAHSTITTIAGHLQALGTNGLPVTRITTTAGVWIGVMSLSARPSYFGDDADLNAPRTESGKPQENGYLKCHWIIKCWI